MYNSLKMLWRILRGFLKINGELKHISIDVLKKELYSSWQSSYLHHTSGAITDMRSDENNYDSCVITAQANAKL